ncbi:MAG: class I SAM-dependent methyltransferase [Pseudomonadota bacterium]
MSEQFEARWLALREHADAVARAPGVAAALSQAFAGRQGASSPLRVLDLGAGAGNNLRATAPLLPAPQHWTLVDSDAGLLAEALRERPEGVTAEEKVADLADGLEPLLEPAALPDLVTASALFDLCSEEWIAAFVATLTAARLPFFTVLSYDGRQDWQPPHPLDTAVLEAFHRDQRRDKGLGPALGPDAHDALAGMLRNAGYSVIEGTSDWVLDAPADDALIAALAAGTAAAVGPALGADASVWGAARAGASPVRIGHMDLLALPPSR